jgi:PIN domain nuclease of toxin-antitoxin system
LNLLLDTHAFIWFAQDNPRLSRTALEAIEGAGNTILVSAASVYEVSFKATLGKLNLALSWESLHEVISGFAFVALPITITHAEQAGKLNPEYRDPFDRLLTAQCLTERIQLVTSDPIFNRLGVSTLW